MSEYTSEALEVCKRVVRSINAESGIWGSKCVVIGGLVPPLIGIAPPEGLSPHIGTTDVDIGIQVAAVADEANLYRTLKNVLTILRFKQTEPSFTWVRDVDGMPAKVELFCSVGNQKEAGRIQTKPFDKSGSGLTALGVYGLELIEKDIETIENEGPLLDDRGIKKVNISVCGPAMLILLKGLALHERTKEKDGYDVVWLLRAHGADALAARFIQAGLHLQDAGLKSLESLANAFKTPDYTGPIGWVSVAGFEGDDREREKREAVGIVGEFCRICREQ